ncbi:MAG TPA: gamma-glutamyltransferase, partial [Propionibacteriaceae bacterium]|nr:gamma-glutamyltransferase [Propionibacteriaceae bacterium]
MLRRSQILASALTTLAAIVLVAPPADAAPQAPPKDPIAVGRGGAVSSVDPYATQIGLNVLRRGGNAVDAAVATAAALGVTEPYSTGIGGGGFFVYYDAHTRKVHTIDGRETAPADMKEDSFIDPATGQPLAFADAVTSGLSVGVPGTPATWELALKRWGSIDLRQALRPAAQLARRGFVVDETFRQQTADNAERFAAFSSTRELFLPGGAPPAVGSVLRNPDLARTYTQLGRRGTDYLYEGRLGEDIVATVRQPPVVPDSTRHVRPGLMRLRDLDRYRALLRKPTRINYRGLTVAGMAPPSSGGSTVGEALNILERSDLAALKRSDALHRYLEAT